MPLAAPPLLDALGALADQTRCRMLLVLERRELTVGELADVLQLPQSTVSRHLKVLADTGWVGLRRDGTSRFYQFDPSADPGLDTVWALARDQVADRPGAAQDQRRLKPVLATMQKVKVKGIAHITGGGLTENIPRVLPAGVCAKLEASRWPRQKIFQWLKRHGNIEDAEMHRTFNCGIGMVLIVTAAEAKATIDSLAANGVEAFEIGSIVAREEGAAQTVVV